jgi:hypothetical protein
MKLAVLVRRGGCLAVASGSLLAARVEGQGVVFAHARLGCDTNTGAAGQPVQTLTRALQIAAGNPSIRWTINVAGAASGSARIPYDDRWNASAAPGGCPGIPLLQQGLETFPLQMRPQVSLVWDTTNSDSIGGLKVRPLVRKDVPFATGSLLEFGAGYAAGASPVSLTSLDFEFADPTAIDVLTTVAGTVRPALTNLIVSDCTTGFRANTSSRTIVPTIASSTFELRPSTPAPPSTSRFIDMRAQGSSNAVVGGSITDCTFSTDASKATYAGVQLGGSSDGRIVDLTIRNSLFRGGSATTPPNMGMNRGVFVSSGAFVNPATAPPVQMTVSGSTFTYCVGPIDVSLQTQPGVVDVANSSVTVSGNQFTGSFRGFGVPASPFSSAQGQVMLSGVQGKRITMWITGNTFGAATARAIDVRNLNSGGGSFIGPPGYVNLQIDRNVITNQALQGMLFLAQSLDIRGTVSRNKITDVTTWDGIYNYAISDAIGAATSNVDLVNNVIAYTGRDGIRNKARQDSSFYPVQAIPRLTHDTVYHAGGSALNNLAGGALGTYQAFPVWSSIFRASVGGLDLAPGVVLGSNVQYCTVQYPIMTTYNNNNASPGFVNPASGISTSRRPP